jgi:secreted PhoX family phosphatase
MAMTKTRITNISALLGGALLATTALTASPLAAQEGLTRFATVPLGAEITGIYVTQAGDLFFNAQHPADSNMEPYNRAMIGVVTGLDINELPASFEAVKVPETDAEKQSITTALGSYQVIAKEGDFDKAVPGGLGAIMSADSSKTLRQSNDPDFNAYVPLNDLGTEGYLFTNWEDRPGGMSRIKLMKGDDGSWQVDQDDVMMVDFSPVKGTWVNCFGSLSPWNTPLTSEELYFDDTAEWNNPEYEYHDQQLTLAEHVGTYPNPYDYGYIVELTDPTGSVTPVKHFTMGRYSHENSVVMPDNKTAYLSDDGTGVVFFKFVADEAGDLSAGTLYGAKVTQDEGDDPATVGFDVEWVELAHGDDGTIQGWIREYDGITPDDYQAEGNNYITDEEIAAWANGEAADDRAAFLESRKAAVAKGATGEFRKMEGVQINYEAAKNGSVPIVYMAMSEVNKTMADDEGAIQLTANDCGVVYAMALDENWNVSRMEPAVAGGPHNGDLEANQCSVDNISNPDNLQILNDGRVIIGEDTGAHENNMIWVWQPKT